MFTWTFVEFNDKGVKEKEFTTKAGDLKELESDIRLNVTFTKNSEEGLTEFLKGLKYLTSGGRDELRFETNPNLSLHVVKI